MKRNFSMLLGALAALILVSCNSNPTITSPEHVEWKVEKMADYESAIADENRPTLKLFMAKAVGSTGCNSFNGSFSLQSESIKFPAPTFALTKKMCPPNLMEIEKHYIGLLGRVESWTIDGDNVLHLKDGTGTELLVMSFVRELESTETL